MLEEKISLLQIQVIFEADDGIRDQLVNGDHLLGNQRACMAVVRDGHVQRPLRRADLLHLRMQGQRVEAGSQTVCLATPIARDPITATTAADGHHE